jgi:hypothetical protein
MREPVHFIPIITTLISIPFTIALLRRYRERGGMHLLWWGIGVATFGVGTFTEGFTTLFGWQEPIFRLWYISGALLGGWPLAQGTIYLMFSRKTADRMMYAVLSVIAVAAVCCLLSPINMAAVETHRLTGSVFEWQWVRAFSPFVNLYAAIFLIGGAAYSAYRYMGQPDARHRAIGNVFIALGALLPGIGGSFTRFGYTEVLYVTELLGLSMIWIGYRYNVRGSAFGEKRVDWASTPVEEQEVAPEPA